MSTSFGGAARAIQDHGETESQNSFGWEKPLRSSATISKMGTASLLL